MGTHANHDAWLCPRHGAAIALDVDGAPIAAPDGDGVKPGDVYRDNRGRIIVVLGVADSHCPCVIFDANGELATVDRIALHRLERKVRLGRLKEMPRWSVAWGGEDI